MYFSDFLNYCKYINGSYRPKLKRVLVFFFTKLFNIKIPKVIGHGLLAAEDERAGQDPAAGVQVAGNAAFSRSKSRVGRVESLGRHVGHRSF